MVPSSGLAVWAVCLVSCVVSAASSPVAAGLTAEGDDKTWTVAHNKYRCLHGGPYLTWNQWVADSAQEWSNKLKSGEESGHSKSYNLGPPQGPAGENLAWGHRDQEHATSAWYNEYDLWIETSQDSFSSGTGHFTAMVWKGVRQLGCGTAERTYTCRYKARDKMGKDTPNMGGGYTTQVPKRGSRSEKECEEEAEYIWYLVKNYTAELKEYCGSAQSAYIAAAQMYDEYAAQNITAPDNPADQPIIARDWERFTNALDISQGDRARLLAIMDRSEDGEISNEEFMFVADDGVGAWKNNRLCSFGTGVDDTDLYSDSVRRAPLGLLSATIALFSVGVWVS
mmetsp:Transcript_13354/g.38489  ORF Transcript_13354/g.38489 Transcript_13354/m.38489 type:complete len:339 (+) Transcript_13354:144-1160(+)